MKGKTALLIVDMINKLDFKGGENLLSYIEPMVEPLLTLKKHTKEQGIPTIYVNDNFGLWREDIKSLINQSRNGIGKDIVDQFIPEKDDFFIIKPKHSGFYGTQLDILLKHLDIDNLIITGVAGNYCVIFTAFDAYMREYNLWVPRDCTASEKREDNEDALRLINRAMFASTKSSTKVEIEKNFI